MLAKVGVYNDPKRQVAGKLKPAGTFALSTALSRLNPKGTSIITYQLFSKRLVYYR
jgi:hypothetical protein